MTRPEFVPVKVDPIRGAKRFEAAQALVIVELRARNAELIAALEKIAHEMEIALDFGGNADATWLGRRLKVARDALAKVTP